MIWATDGDLRLTFAAGGRPGPIVERIVPDGRAFTVKSVDTLGMASKLTHINYAFGNVTTDLVCDISEVEGEGMGVGDAQWVLVEDVEVSCAWWLMPFVKGKMEQAHRDVCRKVIEKTDKLRSTGWVGRDPVAFGEHGVVSRQDSKVEGTEDVNTGFAQETRQHYAKPQPVVFGQTHQDIPGPVEADAIEPQRTDTVAGPLPDKITYR